MNYPAPRFLSLEELASDLPEAEPSDLEIVDLLIEEFPLSRIQAVERLSVIDFASLRNSLKGN